MTSLVGRQRTVADPSPESFRQQCISFTAEREHLHFSSCASKNQETQLGVQDLGGLPQHDLGAPIDITDINAVVHTFFGPESSVDLFQARIQTMLSEVESITDTPSYMDTESWQSSIQRSKTLLTVPVTMRFIDSFFLECYSHFPYFHRASFNPLTVRLPVLLLVVIFGAIMSADKCAATLARSLFDIAEHYVFKQPVFTTDPPSELSTQELQKSIQQLEELQAAYCVQVIQEYEGSPAARLRGRKVRLVQIVEVSKRLHPRYHGV
jgi:Fungal specific transcription factor domain